MKKALIIYYSRTGTTKRYAEEIAGYLETKDVPVQVTSTVLFNEAMFEGVTHIFFGCWTSGLFFILQKPEKAWVNFAARLPARPDAKIALFTTYKILTGSMFKNMAKELAGKFASPALGLKSRNAVLSAEDKRAIDQFMA